MSDVNEYKRTGAVRKILGVSGIKSTGYYNNRGIIDNKAFEQTYKRKKDNSQEKFIKDNNDDHKEKNEEIKKGKKNADLKELYESEGFKSRNNKRYNALLKGDGKQGEIKTEREKVREFKSDYVPKNDSRSKEPFPIKKPLIRDNRDSRDLKEEEKEI